MTTAFGPGHMLRAYRVEARLGQGAQAVTWRATDTRDGRPVALKRFALSRAETWKDLELFRRECAVLATLSHPCIPAYVDSFEEPAPGGDTELFLVQELVPAPSLADLIKEGRRWSKDELVDMARRLLSIVGWLHQRHPPVVHRDIKPSNVLRGADGNLWLIDFTAVQSRLHSAPGGGSTVVGTHGYMAPEQLLGRAGTSSDLYAIGMTLVHLASAHHPSELPLDGLRVDFRAVVNLDAKLIAWLERMTAPDPGARPPSAEAALRELERALAPTAVTRATPGHVTPLPTRTRPRRRWVWPAVGVCALVAIVLASRGADTLGPTKSAIEQVVTTSAPPLKREEQFKDIAAEVNAPPGIAVTVRAARLRLGGSLGEPTTIDIAYLLHNRGAEPIGRVRIRAIAQAVTTQTLTRLEPVSVLQVPLAPGETRRETGSMYDTPRSVTKVVLEVTIEEAPPLPPEARVAIAVSGLEKLPAGVEIALVERRAFIVEAGLSVPRKVFDVELALRGVAQLFALTLAPTCQTPAGPRQRQNDRDFTVLMQSLVVQTLEDGELSAFRVLCPVDATAVTWRVASVMAR